MPSKSYQYVKTWREKNRDKLREYNHNYIVRHREELKVKRRERYLRSKQNAGEKFSDPIRELATQEQPQG